ncbi:hypothetical protein BG000_004511 [Podila horticola]|nr:hypothetical protein BG000_004511 [Podila horticola]
MALSRLHDGNDDMRYPSSDSNVPLKDAFVALSGIWNMFSAEANKAFNDRLTEGKQLCLRKELEMPDDAFATLIKPLVSMADEGPDMDDLIEKLYELQAIPSEFRRSLDALKTIFKHAERPLHGKSKDPAEADSMSLWSSIFREQLPARTSLALNLELDLAIQLQKNIKINKSILLQLERDVSGGCHLTEARRYLGSWPRMQDDHTPRVSR